MKNVIHLIRRFTLLLLASVTALLIVNLLIFSLLFRSLASGDRPWTTTRELAGQLEETDTGYVLDAAGLKTMQKKQLWALLIDNDTMEVLWKSEDLPASVPQQFNAALIANLKTGYIDSYPTFTEDSPYGLFVVGYPQNAYWKLVNPSWDTRMITHFPIIVTIFLVVNLAILVIIYLISTGRLMRSLGPLARGIQNLPSKDFSPVKESGTLAGLAQDINKTADILKQQQIQLQKKDMARANWIAGVSHDIRTPLSMVMGYAAQLMQASSLPEDTRKKTRAIFHQSAKMKALINDLNLASSLEYHMQPLHKEQVNLVTLARQVAADFINTDAEELYPILFSVSGDTRYCEIIGDKDLLRRAFTNLIQNCINHNEQGCEIYLSLEQTDHNCIICIEDNGNGASEEEIERQNHLPHYMMCDTSTSEQRHGLGLLIVRQVVSSHNGTFEIGHSEHGGFLAKITLLTIL